MKPPAKFAIIFGSAGAALAVGFFLLSRVVEVFPSWLISTLRFVCPPYTLFLARACMPFGPCIPQTLLIVAAVNAIIYAAFGLLIYFAFLLIKRRGITGHGNAV